MANKERRAIALKKAIEEGTASGVAHNFNPQRNLAKFKEVVKRLRSNSEEVPDLDDVTCEVEAVRSKRYDH